jgi:precorrin-6A/cobalt-precorrin-6A reductase
MPMMNNQGSDTMRVLLLGGTTEAAQMARALSDIGIDAVYSYAGRTATPVTQPIPMRVGGFGGVAGLADYLHAEKITHVIDATHPFAARISRNAIAACAAASRPLIALERPPWAAQPGDLWTHVADEAGAADILPEEPWTVFLAIGRQRLDAFAAKPQHAYILRIVDPPADPMPMPNAKVILARGPFDVAGDTALLQDHGVDLIVAKNAGGAGAEAKLIAARSLCLPVIMIDRPTIPPRATVATVQMVMDWLHHTPADLGV